MSIISVPRHIHIPVIRQFNTCPGSVPHTGGDMLASTMCRTLNRTQCAMPNGSAAPADSALLSPAVPGYAPLCQLMCKCKGRGLVQPCTAYQGTTVCSRRHDTLPTEQHAWPPSCRLNHMFIVSSPGPAMTCFLACSTGWPLVPPPDTPLHPPVRSSYFFESRCLMQKRT
jgi:hypothetical protein